MSKLANRQITPSRLESTYFPFEGGLNMVDPSLALKPGELVAAENFEIDIRGRYRRVDGYERFDGQTLPSDITYYRIPFTIGTARDSVFVCHMLLHLQSVFVTPYLFGEMISDHRMVLILPHHLLLF